MINVQLSAEEMQLVGNSEWILTKHRIIDKVYGLFGNLAAQMQAFLQEKAHAVPEQALQWPAKISKGEQYEKLPYVVLDYPRFFSKTEVFAVRTFFWWGNYFSITMHLKGMFCRQWYQRLANAVAGEQLQDFYISFSGNEFSFNLSDASYVTGTPGNFPATPACDFLKISYKIGFDQWETAEQKLMDIFERFTNM